MQFLVNWTIKPDSIKAAHERFMEGGATPPDGIKMLARWHDASGGRGWSIAETDDATRIATWCNEWTDLLTLEVVPVISDEQFSAVLQG